MVLDESVECLELLLNESDEDLVALLLSEKRKMEASGKELDPKLHTEVGHPPPSTLFGFSKNAFGRAGG